MLFSKLYQNFSLMQPSQSRGPNSAPWRRNCSNSFSLLHTQSSLFSRHLNFFISQSCIFASNVTLPKGRAGVNRGNFKRRTALRSLQHVSWLSVPAPCFLSCSSQLIFKELKLPPNKFLINSLEVKRHWANISVLNRDRPPRLCNCEPSMNIVTL